MKYYKISPNGSEEQSTLLPGSFSRNMADEPHLGEFLEDSWLVEYKIGTKARQSVTTDYEPYRDQVRRSSGEWAPNEIRDAHGVGLE